MVSDLPLPVVCQITPPVRALSVEVGDAGDSGLDGEVLLIAGDLLDAVVIDDVLIEQLQEAGGP